MNGNIVARYDYDPYGKPTQTLGAMQFDFLYTGHFYQYSTELYLAPYRAYNAQLGRWISRDPIGIAGGLNLYHYVFANPLSMVDPTGLLSRFEAAWASIDVLGGLESWAGSGMNQGGFVGGAKATIGIAAVGAMDTIGLRGVESSFSNSGSAYGQGNYGQAAAWGLAGAGQIYLSVGSVSAASNLRTYVQGPMLYEKGSAWLDDASYAMVQRLGLNPVQTGMALNQARISPGLGHQILNALRAFSPKALATGPTPGGAMAGLLANQYGMLPYNDVLKSFMNWSLGGC